MKQKWTLIFGLALLPLWLEAAPSVPGVKRLNQQRNGQVRIGASLNRVKGQLDKLIAEYNNNGLEGDDVNALKRFRGMLNKLTEEEITQIIMQLDKSNLLKESKTGDSALVAFDSQKDVITDLNTIYLEWQQQQIFRELSERFKKLSETQRKNMYRAVQTAQAHNQIIPTNPSEEFKIDVRIQELDQTGIADEAQTLIKKLEELGKKISQYIEPRPRMALRLVESDLQPALDASTKHIQEYDLVKAAGLERTSYIAMINIARILAPKRDDEEIIRQALQDVKDAIDDQQDLRDDTFQLDESENPNSDELSRQQADLVDRTDFIRQDVAELVPNAAQALGLSTDSQQEARAALSTPTTNAAAAAAQQRRVGGAAHRGHPPVQGQPGGRAVGATHDDMASVPGGDEARERGGT